MNKKFKMAVLLFAIVFLFAAALNEQLSYAVTESSEISETEKNAQVSEAGDNSTDSTGMKAVSAAIAIGLAAAGGAIAMGISIAKAVSGISRQPEADGKIRTSLMLGLVFIETVVIYSLIVAILIVFVL